MNNTEKTYINFVLEAEQRYNTHEVRVSLETAKMLQKAGFDWECECAILPASLMADKAYHYNHGGSHNYNDKETYPFEIYSAPTLAVAQKWLREAKGMHIYVKPCDIYNEQIESWSSRLFYKGNDIIVRGGAFGSYEDALEAGIQKCLTILLEEKK